MRVKKRKQEKQKQVKVKYIGNCKIHTPMGDCNKNDILEVSESVANHFIQMLDKLGEKMFVLVEEPKPEKQEKQKIKMVVKEGE